MENGTLKTSTIFVSRGEQTQVFRSLDELPEEMRRELESSTNGFNSATILIADRKGREQIRRSLAGLPTPLRTRLAQSMEAATAVAPVAVEEAPLKAPAPEPGHSYYWWMAAVAAVLALVGFAAARLG
jgi:hypothetical protein